MRSLCCSLIVFTCFSCSNDHKTNDIRNFRYPSQLLRYVYFNTEFEKFLSFPLLFDAKVIHRLEIKSIIRKYFVIDSSEAGRQEELRDEWCYRFYNTFPLSVEIKFFYDRQIIGRKKITYAHQSDALGFRQVTIEPDSSRFSEKEFTESGFHIDEPIKRSARMLHFRDKTSGRRLFFIPQKMYWGALSVDSICHPRSNDRIVLGVPKKPLRIYSVKNKVEENGVTDFYYHPLSGRIERMVTNDFPFEVTRTFLYDKHGYCNCYIDSAFCSREFLSRTVSRIWLNKEKLPVLIVHRKETAFRNLGVTSYEKFIYEK